MALPSPVPPPVIRMRLELRRSLRNMSAYPEFLRRFSPTAGSSPGSRRVRNDKLYRWRLRHRRRVAGHAESVVGIVELWRDAGSGGASGNFHVMAPGAATRGFALALLRAAWIAIGRNGIVVGIVPVAAPLVNVVAHVMQAQG